MARLFALAAALVAIGALAATGAPAEAAERPAVRAHGPYCTAPRCRAGAPHPARPAGFAAAALAAIRAGRRRQLRRG